MRGSEDSTRGCRNEVKEPQRNRHCGITLSMTAAATPVPSEKPSIDIGVEGRDVLQDSNALTASSSHCLQSMEPLLRPYPE